MAQQTDEKGKPMTYWGGNPSHKQQTAVEWLYRWFRDNPETTHEEGNKALEQAKQMEYEQYDHAFLYGKLYAEQNYTYTLDELTKMAEETWEGCHGCDDNDKNFWINGFITGMNYKKIN